MINDPVWLADYPIAMTLMVRPLTIFHFFDEGGRSIFNIHYQYLGRGGRGLVSCSRFSAERLLQKGHLFASGDAKSSNTGMPY